MSWSGLGAQVAGGHWGNQIGLVRLAWAEVGVAEVVMIGLARTVPVSVQVVALGKDAHTFHVSTVTSPLRARGSAPPPPRPPLANECPEHCEEARRDASQAARPGLVGGARS